MKQLYDYILENAIGDLGISFEDFCNFVVDNDKGARKKISDALVKKFGPQKGLKLIEVLTEKYYEFLFELKSMKVEADEIMLQFIYKQFTQTPESKIEKFIGSGLQGAAFVIGDKIIKCYFRNRIPKEHFDFFTLCKSGKYDVLPRVYRIGKGYVVMEKLNVHSKKCLDIINELHKVVAGKDTLYHLIQDGDLYDVKLSPKQKQAVEFMMAIRKPLDDLGFGPRNYGDLHSDNLGERDDGTVVYFDI